MQALRALSHLQIRRQLNSKVSLCQTILHQTSLLYAVEHEGSQDVINSAELRVLVQ